MCLLIIASHAHPRYPLIIAANRDEVFNRPTAAAHYWDDHPGILAGRDLDRGGTWMAVDRLGRVAAVTNYRDRSAPRPGLSSRGSLVTGYLTGTQSAAKYLADVAGRVSDYNSFNLCAGDSGSIWVISSADPRPRRLPRGVHGISNGSLDVPWPKVERGRQALQTLLEEDAVDVARIFGFLQDREVPVESQPPAGPAAESWAVPVFVSGADYGTRCSTVLLAGLDGSIQYHETGYDRNGMETNRTAYSFTVMGS